MSTVEQDVVCHYTHGSLGDSIRAGLAKAGAVTDAEAIDQLAAVDEFHIGGREATAEIVGQLELQPTHSVVDIGCGIGGTARFLASRYGCRVTGVDLTPEYVEVGNSLSHRVGLSSLIDLRVASALDLPFETESFDRATVFHVGMNIRDKRKLFAEIARVLKRGARIAVYEVMRTGDAELRFPVPWAQSAEMSFVEAADDYRAALQAAGFDIVAERNRYEIALAFFRRMKARVAETGMPPLGLHVIMGAQASTKIANMIENLERGAIAPVEMIARTL